jgi:ligand-binding sensor domain-containing protein/signal transduction histidine kinase
MHVYINCKLRLEKVWCLLLLLLVTSLTIAQSSPPFVHLTTSDGLSQSNVKAIVADSRGFMWFGTQDGLNKFDGYAFTVYRYKASDTASISHNYILSLAEDQQNQLWIGTYWGLNRFNPETETFTHYFHDPQDPESLSSNDIRVVYVDRRGRLWVGTDGGGLNLFNAATGTFRRFQHHPEDPHSISSNTISSLLEDGQGNLWIATHGGLNLLDPQTERFSHFQHDPQNPHSISSNRTSSLLADSRGNLWVGTDGGGLNRMGPERGHFVHFRHRRQDAGSIGNNSILSLAEDATGTIWVGTQNGGISLLSGQQTVKGHYVQDVFNPESLNNNSIHSLYCDTSGNMWVGTYAGGINLLSRQRSPFALYKHEANTANSLSHSNVLSATLDRQGVFWIGTDGGGVNRFDKASNTFTHFKHDPENPHSLSNDFVIASHQDRQGRLWFGTLEGLNLYHPQTQSFTRFTHHPKDSSSLSAQSVISLLQDRRGNFWIGTWRGGLNLYNPQSKTFRRFKHNPADAHSLSNNVVTAIFEDSQDNLWVGTETGGLNLLDREQMTFRAFMHTPGKDGSLSNNFVYTIAEDSEGQLWIGTAAGLNLYDAQRGTFTSFTEEDGLPNGTIYGILEDDNKHLWISTNRGIFQFDIKSKKVKKRFFAVDGLQGMDFKRQACAKNAAGQLLFGGPNGLNIFHPDSVLENNIVPPVVITGFQIFNTPVTHASDGSPLQKPIGFTEEITLSHEASVFTFEFAALNYVLPQKNQYAYKLEGFDKDWNQAGTRRAATYTNLNPGTYIFRVIGSNNDGVWNPEGSSIRLVINPPLWKSWWFRMVLAVAVAAMAYGAYRYRINRLHARRERLEVQNRALKRINAELELLNRELNKTNAELDSFVYRTSHDLRAPLTSIQGLINLTKIEQELTCQQKYLGLIEKSVKKLDIFIKNIIDYSRNSRTKIDPRPIHFEELIEETFDELKYMEGSQPLDKQVDISCTGTFYTDPYRLKMILNNLLSNAIRYSKPGSPSWIKVVVKTNEKSAEIQVCDNGIGIPAESLDRIFDMFYRASQSNTGSGLGLYIVKESVDVLGGTLAVTSQPGKGSTFKIVLPVLTPGQTATQPVPAQGILKHSSSDTV